MQNLMDILSFKINLKNSENLNNLMKKVEDVLTKIADIENHAQDNQNKIDLHNKDLQEWMKEISSKLQDSNSAYKKLEYHCRFPGRGINIKQNGKFLSNKFIKNFRF